MKNIGKSTSSDAVRFLGVTNISCKARCPKHKQGMCQRGKFFWLAINKGFLDYIKKYLQKFVRIFPHREVNFLTNIFYWRKFPTGFELPTKLMPSIWLEFCSCA
jgi:hypothetical protein